MNNIKNATIRNFIFLYTYILRTDQTEKSIIFYYPTPYSPIILR